MKQRDDLPRPRVYPGDIRPLVAVAGEARQAKVLCLRLAEVMLGDDVIDLERQVEVTRRNLAVFAAASRPLPHEFLQRAIHVCSMHPGRTVVLLVLERQPGLGLHQRQHVPDPLIIVDLDLLTAPERPLLTLASNFRIRSLSDCRKSRSRMTGAAAASRVA